MAEELPILSLILLSPLIGVALAALFRDAHNALPARLGALFSSFITFALSWHLWYYFDETDSSFQFVEKVAWVPQYGINYHLGIDGFSFFFMFLLTFLMPLAILGSWKMDKMRWQFQVQMLLLQVSMLGCFMAMDVVLFYVCFEVMLVPMYMLIGIWGGKNRQLASNKFFIYTMFGSLFMLAAMITTASLHQQQFGAWSFSILDWYKLTLDTDTQYVLFAGFALAFAIKVPMFPFHTWLPDAHYEAPTAGSVELAAVLLKIGPYGLLRFAFPIFPIATMDFIPIACALALIGIIYGGLVAMVQQQIKKLIAYSSIAHMGYIMLGLFVFNEQGLSGAWMQMINHAIVTGALFLAIGMIYDRTHTQEIAQYGGMMQSMPKFAVFLLLFSMASIGLPGLNSFVGEILIMLGAARVNIWYAVIAAAGTVIAAIYMLWLVQRIMFGKVRNAMIGNLRDLSIRELCVLTPLAVLTVLFGVHPSLFLDKIEVTVQDYLKLMETKQMVVEQTPQVELPKWLSKLTHQP